MAVAMALGVWLGLAVLVVLWWPGFVGRTEAEDWADRDDEARHWRSREN